MLGGLDRDAAIFAARIEAVVGLGGVNSIVKDAGTRRTGGEWATAAVRGDGMCDILAVAADVDE